jgi:hypothetical protein
MMKILAIISWAGLGLIFIGFALLSLVQMRHASRNGGVYRSLLKKPAADDIKLLKVAAVLLFFGILILLIGTVQRYYQVL